MAREHNLVISAARWLLSSCTNHTARRQEVISDKNIQDSSPSSSCSARTIPSSLPHLVPGSQVLVLLLALTQGLPLGVQRLDQVAVLQAAEGELLRQNLEFPLVGGQLLAALSTHKQTNKDSSSQSELGKAEFLRNSSIFQDMMRIQRAMLCSGDQMHLCCL